MDSHKVKLAVLAAGLIAGVIFNVVEDNKLKERV